MKNAALTAVVIAAMGLLGLAACKKSSGSSSGGGSTTFSTFTGTWNSSTGQDTHVSGGCGGGGTTTTNDPIALSLTQSGSTVSGSADGGAVTISGTVSGATATFTYSQAAGLCGATGGTGTCTGSNATTMSCTFNGDHCDDCDSNTSEETLHTTTEVRTFTKA